MWTLREVTVIGGDNSCFVAILDMEILVPVMNQLYCKFSDGAGQ